MNNLLIAAAMTAIAIAAASLARPIWHCNQGPKANMLCVLILTTAVSAVLAVGHAIAAIATIAELSPR